MFDSPLHYCPVCRQYVALDQSQPECAREHGCSPRQPCPLAHLFRAPDSAQAPLRESAAEGSGSGADTTPGPAPR
ncbi:MAG TPA: hypothetical protein VNM24_17490 [Burkholderiales bacterium]|jgi:hypothetical protein|nr:hypothetical protein [Burkholderiales bacterium]